MEFLPFPTDIVHENSAVCFEMASLELQILQKVGGGGETV